MRWKTRHVFFATSAYVYGPLIAFVAVAVLAAILRWTFDSDVARTERLLFGRPDLAEPADYGLLQTAAVVENIAEARELQSRLADAGIRATLAPTKAGCVNVLVFESQLADARRVVGGFTTL
jgi:hypothetical protein